MRLLLAGWIIGGLAAVALAEPAETSPPPRTSPELHRDIAALIQALDAPSFAARRRAEGELLKIGPPALPALLAAERNKSAEVRARARSLARALDDAELGRSFDRIARMKIDDDIDKEEVLWLLARIVDPLASREELTGRLDQFAAQVREQLTGVEPKRADPVKALQAIREVLHVRAEITGNSAANDTPPGSSAIRILQAKSGQAPVVAEMVVAVARRLELPVTTVAVPGSAMVKYDGRKRPKAYPGGDLILDIDHGFRLFAKVEELADMLRQQGVDLDPTEDLRPLAHRVTTVRMLGQLVQDFSRTGREDKSTQAASYLRLIDRSGELFELDP